MCVSKSVASIHHYWARCYQSVFFNFWRTHVHFLGPLIPLFWTSSDVVSYAFHQSFQWSFPSNRQRKFKPFKLIYHVMFEKISKVNVFRKKLLIATTEPLQVQAREPQSLSTQKSKQFTWENHLTTEHVKV